ncbi:hypothetical protein AVEN_1120-1 [Araneus ventricosus]|uniref:Uncharacterized protein n=1 Tax=Araneus ventricosus TaxID=182803 RepID=A0A4Y2LFR8_ARAVE|nr:hypothetical protein AVEN_1120-1 [Araneus ventricosus]
MNYEGIASSHRVLWLEVVAGAEVNVRLSTQYGAVFCHGDYPTMVHFPEVAFLWTRPCRTRCINNKSKQQEIFFSQRIYIVWDSWTKRIAKVGEYIEKRRLFQHQALFAYPSKIKCSLFLTYPRAFHRISPFLHYL